MGTVKEKVGTVKETVGTVKHRLLWKTLPTLNIFS